MSNPNQPNRKSEEIRRVNRVIQTRTFVLMLVMSIGVFVLLFAKLYELQIVRHEELQSQALDQQTRSTEVTASRGTIYDRGGNILSISATAETIFLSPKELSEQLIAAEKTKRGEITDEDEKVTLSWTKEQLVQELAAILEISEESIYKKMERTYSEYEVLKLRAEEEVANQVREFLNEYNVRGVYLVTDAKRYYPYGTLASHIVGFVGDENKGLYGLEARYEQELEGQKGLVITARDNAGNDMLYAYEKYYDAENGNDLILTLDTTVQHYLEKNLEDAVNRYDAVNGGVGIVLNAKTGAILGMASYPNYDLNSASTVRDSRLAAAVEDGSASLGDMQLKQWRNKALNDTYEPGSTFKILTLAAALEEDVINENSYFYCDGYTTVMGERINCSGHHESQSMIETVGNSCNPAFISYGMRMGTETFYDYMRAFGLVGGSGVDLDGEATGIFIDESIFTELDLACYAFGQNFNITPIALVAAQAACVNGGYLYEPYVVEQVVGDDGTVLYQHDNTPVRQVISEETSAKVRECLEYVVSEGTGGNAQVSGYRIGGKTGTADKGKTGDVVVSFAGCAPADNPEVMVLVALDTPGRDTGTYPSGGAMAAPVVGAILSEILPYLGIDPAYSAEELMGADTTVPYVLDMSVSDAIARLENKGFSYKIIGDGDTVTDQTPAGGVVIPGKSTVILYAGEEKPDDLCSVPALVGKTPAEANLAATNAGLLLRFSGATGASGGTIRVLTQSESVGAQVPAGTVITAQLGDIAVAD